MKSDHLKILGIAVLCAVSFCTERARAATLFTNVTADVGLPLVGNYSVAWADFDNDGRMDLLLGRYSSLWRNTGSGFSDVTATLAPEMTRPDDWHTAVAWGDYDNDGRPDMLLVGYGSRLLHNTVNGFVDVTATLAPDLPRVLGGSVAWGDFDNDGRLDFILTGSYVTQIWRNTGNGFSNITSIVAPNLPGVATGSAAWCDYDNDGRLDFLLTGGIPRRIDLDDDIPMTPIAQLWRNTGNGFENVTATAAPGLSPCFWSSVAWGDYDNDGRPDFILTGATRSSIFSELWHNTGTGFVNVTTAAPGLPAIIQGPVAWGDYDNDGRLDILLAGQIWRNMGGTFMNVTTNVAPGFGPIASSSVQWGDYDNDGRLDFIISGDAYYFCDGCNEPPSKTQLWHNTSTDTNAPAAVITKVPSNLGLTSLVLNGTAHPHRQAASAWFVWGDSTNYGQVTAAQALGSGNAWTNFSQAIAGLSAGATYYYRAVASNAQGVVLGVEQRFVLAGPGVTTSPLGDFSGNTATIKGQVTPNNLPTYGWFEWGLTPALGQLTPAQFLGNGFSATLRQNLYGIPIGATFYFRGVVSNILGVAYGAAQSLVMVDAPYVCFGALSPPSRLYSSASTMDYVYVQLECNWIASTTNSWITINSPTNGDFSGTPLFFTVAANNEPQQRIGNITIGGQNFKVVQAAGSATLVAQPSTQTVLGGGTANFSVIITGAPPFSYQWQFNGVPLTNGMGVSGATTANLMLTGVQFSRAGNYRVLVADSAGMTTGFSSVANLSVSCGFSLSAGNANFSSMSSTGQVVLSAAATDCPWDIVNTNGWVTILSKINNTGSGTVIYAVVENPGTSARNGNVLIADQVLTITQAGGSSTSPTISLGDAVDATALSWGTVGTPAWFGQSILSHDGVDATQSGQIDHNDAVTLQATVAGPGVVGFWWKVSSETNVDFLKFFINGVQQTRISGEEDWQQLTFPVGSGAQILKWTYSKNYATSVGQDRGWLDQVQFVPSNPCNLALSPNNRTHDSTSLTGLVSITTAPGCNWTVVNTNDWVEFVSGMSGSGAGVLDYRLKENTGAARTGNLIVGDQVFSLNQLALSTNATVPFDVALDTVGTPLVWDTIGAPAWFGQSSVSHDGTDAAQSGAVDHNGAVTVYTTVEGPGAISFWWKVSSEENKDYLKFFINGVQQTRISGEVDWQPQRYIVPMGTQVFKWTYSKSPAGTLGLDRGWLDQVHYLPGAGECVFALSHNAVTHSYNSDTGQVNVTTDPGCTWSAISTNSWITATVTGGDGSGYVRYTLAANGSAIDRTGVLNIGGQPFTITQLGVPCTYAISPSGRTHSWGAATGLVTVTTTPGCSWNVVNTNAWVTIVSGASNSASGHVTYSLSENTSTARSGNLRIAGQLFTLNQSGSIPCSYSLSTLGISRNSTAGTNAITVTAPNVCTWSVLNTNPWVTLLSSPITSGSGQVLLGISSNATQVTRSGNIVIADQLVAIIQFSMLNSNFIALPEALDTTGSGLVWRTGGSGTWFGQSTVAHDGVDAAQSGSIGLQGSAGLAATVIGPGTITFWWKVSSEANHDALHFYIGGAEQANISGEIDWQQRTFNVPSGSQNLEWNYWSDATGKAGQDCGWLDQVQYTQIGNPNCTFAISPASRSHGYGSTTNSFSVSTQTGCAWNVITTNSWIGILSSLNNSANGIVLYSVAANPNPQSRTGMILVGGQVFVLTQAGAGTNAARLELLSRTATSATLSLQGSPGKTYVVQSSEDLILWKSFSTNSAPATITDSTVGSIRWRFYRAKETP